MHTLCRCHTSIEAHLLKGMLEYAGIEVTLIGEALSGAIGEVPINEAQISVCVDTPKLDKAQNIYAQFIANQHNQGSIFCSHCREENPVSFEVCWSCGTDLI